MRLLAATLALALCPLLGCAEAEAPEVTPATSTLPTAVDTTETTTEPGADEPTDAAPGADETDAEFIARMGDDLVVYYVTSAEAGDRACYLTLEDNAESFPEPVTREASFELCEQGLADTHIAILAEEETQIMAASCEGDPDCTDSDTVMLITEVRTLSL